MICFPFKLRRRRNGVLAQSREYYGKIRLDGESRVSVIPLDTTDLQVARKRLNDEVIRRQREAEGLAVPRAEIAEMNRPLTEHHADFLRALAREEEGDQAASLGRQ